LGKKGYHPLEVSPLLPQKKKKKEVSIRGKKKKEKKTPGYGEGRFIPTLWGK